MPDNSHFLNTVCNPKVKWDKPQYPEVNDPIWLEQFSKGNTVVRQNLAHAWLWRINENNTHLSNDLDLNYNYVRPVLENYKLYRDISKYIDPAYIRQNDYRFNGSYDQVIDTLKINMPGEDDIKFKESLRNAWLGDAIVRVSAISSAVKLYLEHSKTTANLDTLKSLLPCLLWDIVEEAKLGGEWLSSAVGLTVYAAIDGADLPKTSNTYHAAWHALALRSSIPNYLESNEYKLLDVYENIQKGPPAVTATFIPIIFNDCTNNGKNTLATDSPFAERLGQHASVYDVLRDWVPKYTKDWDVAEGLGMEVSDAVNYACTGGNPPDERTNLALPDSILDGDPQPPL